MQKKPDAVDMRILVEMPNTFGVKRRGAADYAMHLIVFTEQQFHKVGSILSCDTSDQCLLHACSPQSMELNVQRRIASSQLRARKLPGFWPRSHSKVVALVNWNCASLLIFLTARLTCVERTFGSSGSTNES